MKQHGTLFSYLHQYIVVLSKYIWAVCNRWTCENVKTWKLKILDNNKNKNKNVDIKM